MARYSDLAEQRIRQAMELGEFDNLPGEGKPLDLGDDDPSWWAMRKLREFGEGEQLEALSQELVREVDLLMFLPDEADVKRRDLEIYVRNVALKEFLPPGTLLRSLDPT